MNSRQFIAAIKFVDYVYKIMNIVNCTTPMVLVISNHLTIPCDLSICSVLMTDKLVSMWIFPLILIRPRSYTAACPPLVVVVDMNNALSPSPSPLALKKSILCLSEPWLSSPSSSYAGLSPSSLRYGATVGVHRDPERGNVQQSER